MTIDQAFDAAVQRQQADRREEAKSIYRQIILRQPTHVESIHNLAVLVSQTGRINDAIDLLRQAIAIKPAYVTAHGNLADLLREQGRLDEAIDAYRRAIALAPTSATVHNNFGVALKLAGRLAEAVAAYRRAVEFRPDFAEAHNNLGNALFDLGRLQEAIAAYSKSIEHRPDWAVPHLNLGHLLRAEGEFERACHAYQKASQTRPNDVTAHACVAAMMAELQRFDEAKIALENAERLAPEEAATHEARGFLLLCSGRGDEAIASFRRVVDLAPDSTTAWNNLGQALRQTGQFEQAADCFRRTLSRPAISLRSLALLATVSVTANSNEFDQAREAFDSPLTSPRDRAALGFALSKWLDAAGRFDEAFDCCSTANRITVELRQAVGACYRPEQFERQIDETIARFTPEYFSRTSGWGNASDLPVFIVGMPRSGTTIVEQVAASHPQVFGAGELRHIDDLSKQLGPVEWNNEMICQVSATHLGRLQQYGGSARRVTDKMPSNIGHLGLIATLFSSARVIICRRDPRDTGLSCFFQQFSNGNLFSFDLAHCGHHQVQTDRLISHWLKVLPLRILEVQYEDVVADVDTQSRRIIDFLDLPWNPACLDFHRTRRTVQTASDVQVRQPIYLHSVARWRNYESHLQPLLSALHL